MAKTIKNKIVYEENINNISGKASAIVFPESIQEIKNLFKLETEDIIPRGGGSSFTGGVIPRDSIIVDMSKMNKILEASISKKTVIVEPGIIVSELNDELEQYGLEFPIEPLFRGIETIGGMIAKNSSGNREIKYSRMLNWIESLEVIDGKGEKIRVSKSDLGDFVGMEGTTGIIIQATLRLTRKKERSLTILKSNSLNEVFSANKKLRFDPEVCSIDLLSREISSLLGLENKYHVFVEFESSKGSFKASDYRKYMNLKSKAYKKASLEGYYYLSNAKLLIDSLQDFILYLEEKHIPYFAHLASGIVYPLFRAEQVEKIQDASRFAKKLRGRVAYNFGIGLTKKDCLELGELELIRRIKLRHDPNNRLNRDKLIDAKIISGKDIREKKLAEALQGEIKSSEQIIQDVIEEKDNLENKKIEESLLRDEIKAIEENQAAEQKPEEPKITEQPEKSEDKIEEKQEPNLELTTLKKPEREVTPEEREKIKKIAFGFFGGGTKPSEEEQKP